MSRSVAGAPRRKRQQCTHRSITVLVHTVIVFLDGDLVSLVVWKCRVALDKSEGVVKTEISWAVREHRLLCQRRLRTRLWKSHLNHSAVESFHQPSIRPNTRP